MSERLPIICRLRGHGWKPRPVRGGWMRRTCRRCEHLNLTAPESR